MSGIYRVKYSVFGLILGILSCAITLLLFCFDSYSIPMGCAALASGIIGSVLVYRGDAMPGNINVAGRLFSVMGVILALLMTISKIVYICLTIAAFFAAFFHIG